MSHQIVITDEQLNAAVDKLMKDIYMDSDEDIRRPDVYLALISWLNECVDRLLLDIAEWTHGCHPFPAGDKFDACVWQQRDERRFKEKLTEASR